MNRIGTLFREHGLFLSVLAIGLVFRLLFMYHQGLSNDELSGWIRTKYTNWNEFWYYGVKFGDMHPVFYQGFLWTWVRIFGDSEFSLRATGLLFYLLNATLIYEISRRFFTKHTGILISVLYAGLAFLVINTVFARPYNSGTFFVLLSFWSILEINRSEKRFNKWTVFLVLGLIGAMLSHYFAFITVGVIGLASIFFVQRKHILAILISGAIACLLFLPHLSVTWFHFTRDGGLGWLGKPHWNWLWDFGYEFSNYSWLLFFLLAVAALFFFTKVSTVPRNRYRTFALVIFIGAYLVAYLLSVVFTPILKDLLMLFILPFFLFFLLGNVQLNETRFNAALILLFPILLGIHSIYSAKLLQPANYAVFREIGENIDHYTQKVGSENLEYALNSCNVEYINYYSETDQPESIIFWEKPETLKQLADRAKNSGKTYFTYNWTNNYHVPMYYEVIRKYYPFVIEHHSYFNSASFLFKKGNPGKRAKRHIEHSYSNTFANITPTSEEFAGELRLRVGDIRKQLSKDGYLLLESVGVMQTEAPLYFTFILERDGIPAMIGDQPIGYASYNQHDFCETGKEQTFLLAFAINEHWKDTDLLKIYFWNPEKQPFSVAKPKVYVIQ